MTNADDSGPDRTGPINWQRELARHDRWLRAVVWSRLGDAHAVDDVMQEVALAAVRQQAALADIRRIPGWLHRVAVTQSLLYRRSLGRRRRLRERYGRFASESTGEPDPLSWLLGEERRVLVRQALGSLAPRDVEVLLLKYSENFSYRQIAEVLEVSSAAVESRLHRAREHLRAALATCQVSARQVFEVES